MHILSNITIMNSVFDSNQAIYYENSINTEANEELSGGGIYYYCDKPKNTNGLESCILYFSENITFINNYSQKKGGAINCIYIEHIFYNLTTGKPSITFINNKVN